MSTNIDSNGNLIPGNNTTNNKENITNNYFYYGPNGEKIPMDGPPTPQQNPPVDETPIDETPIDETPPNENPPNENPPEEINVLIEVPINEDGQTDLNELEKLIDDKTLCSVFPVINFYGVIEDQKRHGEILSKINAINIAVVVEMTSLQGIIGQKYAESSGESIEVALAIKEHYLSSSAEGAAAVSKPSLVVGISDRLDSLAGLFAIGVTPTGTKDPFALRRAAISMLQNLIGTGMSFDIRTGLQESSKLMPVETSPESLQECLKFIIERLKNILLESGYKYDIVDAVINEQGHNPSQAKKAVIQLTEWISRDDWEEILPAYSRCVRITRDQKETFSVDDNLFSEEAESELFTEIMKAEALERELGNVDDMFKAFVPMVPAINKFFDNVLVMDKDEELKNNRLGMIQKIAALSEGTADLSHLEGF